MARTSTYHDPTPPGPMENIFRGWIKTTEDALLVLEAARRGVVPRVTRRFHDLEKPRILTSGAVVVFTEEESGIKRWTDPFLWSASRVMGNFMIYREREDPDSVTPPPYLHSSIESRSQQRFDFELERIIYGSWNKGRGLKEYGLMKKTISMSIEGVMYHLVSYYNASDIRTGALRAASTMAELAGVEISDEVLREVHRLRHPPRVEKGENGRLFYVGERENAYTLSTTEDSSPFQSPLSIRSIIPPWWSPEHAGSFFVFNASASTTSSPMSTSSSSTICSTYSPSISENATLPDSMVFTFSTANKGATLRLREPSKRRFDPYTQSKRHTRTTRTRFKCSQFAQNQDLPPPSSSLSQVTYWEEKPLLISSSSFSRDDLDCSPLLTGYTIQEPVSFDASSTVHATPSVPPQQLWEPTCIGDWVIGPQPHAQQLFAFTQEHSS